MKKVALILAVALITVLFCACGTKPPTSSPEAEGSVAAGQVRVEFLDVDTDTTYAVTLGPGTSAVIGRDKASDLVISDEYVSSTHCKLSLIDGNVYVEDMDSTNGTFLMKDGAPTEVVAATQIEPGDTLVIANVRLMLERIE